ncbi:hypothetical protein Tco_0569279 [Tanacetum coccineum]
MGWVVHSDAIVRSLVCYGFFRHLDFIRLIRGEHGDIHCLRSSCSARSLLLFHPLYLLLILPVIYDDTLLTPTISPTVPTIPPAAPTIQYTSPFIDIDSSDSDTPDSPPSHDPYEAVVAQGRGRVSSLIHRILPAPSGLPRRPVVLSVRSLHTHRLALRYPSDSSSSDQFTSDDSSRDSLSDFSLETSSYSHSDTSSDSSLRHSSSGYAISETLCDSTTVTSERPCHKRCRSLTLLLPVSSPLREALSPVRADLLPPPKRIRDSDSMIDLEISSEDGYESYVPKEVGLGMDVEDSYEPYTEPDIDSDVQADINECTVYADAIRARGMDDRYVVETAAAKEVESSTRGTIEAKVDPRVGPIVDYDMRESVREDVHDHVITDGTVEVTYETLGDLGHMIAGVDLKVTIMTERINALERDNMRLKGMLDVKSQRVDRLHHGLSRA